MQYLSGHQLVLIVGGSIVALIATMMLFTKSLPAEENSMFGNLAVKERKNTSAKTSQSNYYEIRSKSKEQRQSKLRYRERTNKENPFFSFYKEQKKASNKVPKVRNKVTKKKDEGFFTSYNSDKQQEKQFFEATFRESQRVQDGKPLNILLKEPIPDLQLEEGTILKGLPYLEGTRIGIQITAAVTNGQVRKVTLFCFDKEDCVAGLYHDEVAAKHENDIKATLADEFWDFEQEEISGKIGKMAQRGSRLLRRLSALDSNNIKIIIPKGRELLVALPILEE